MIPLNWNFSMNAIDIGTTFMQITIRNEAGKATSMNEI